jgi:hypothetical protein
MSSDKPASLVALARSIASEIVEFQKVLGPGAGDRSTQRFMEQLRERAREVFGADYSEKKICGDNALAVDFYFPDAATVVEVALGLPNPNTEFEKDVLKALMAKEGGYEVDRLVFISRAGAERKCAQPGRAAMRAWAAEKHDLSVEVYDLPGEPRKRVRKAADAPR